jgi:hypothetical protein
MAFATANYINVSGLRSPIFGLRSPVLTAKHDSQRLDERGRSCRTSSKEPATEETTA